MIYLTVKAALSGIIVMIVSEVARRSPGMGGLIASLPLVSILGIMWLWRDTPDVERIAAHAEFYVLVRLAVLADVSGLSSDAETRRRVLDRAWSIVRSDNGALRGDSMAPAQTLASASEIQDTTYPAVPSEARKREAKSLASRGPCLACASSP